MKVGAVVATAIVAALIGGCARTPDIKLGYYLASADLSLKVVRTIICDEKNYPAIVTSVVPALTHSADRGEGQHWLAIKPLASELANADVKLERFEDGRIKGVNAITTGQGEAIVKAAASIIPMLPFDAAPQDFPAECAFIKGAGGGKPLTLMFEAQIDLKAPLNVWKPIEVDLSSAFYFSQLRAAIGEVCAATIETSAGAVPVELVQAGANDVRLRLRQPGRVMVRVAGAKAGGPCGSAKIWESAFSAGQFGTKYELPIPRAALFGKQSFGVTVGESGAMTSVQYGHDSGAAQAIGAFGAMAGVLDETAAEKAAEVKAEADLIAQQQRLALCTARPTECK